MKRWYSSDDLLSRWNRQPFELIELIRNESLQPYSKDALQERKIKQYPTEDEIRFISSKIPLLKHSLKQNIVDERTLDILSDERINEILSEAQWEHYDNDAFDDGLELKAFLDKLIFKGEDIRKFEKENDIDLPIPDAEIKPLLQTETSAENYFKRNGKHWAIKYKNYVADHIDHVDGLQYIAQLLEKPGKDISDQTLYKLAKGVELKETSCENEMNEHNLSMGFKPQPIRTEKERRICKAEYEKLKGELETASIEEREKISEKMEKLEPYLNMKKRNFSNPNDKKAQSNIKKRIDLAYDKLKEENMSELVTHLENTIKTSDYGRQYTGAVIWEIKIDK